jgi:hypothetical protein
MDRAFTWYTLFSQRVSTLLTFATSLLLPLLILKVAAKMEIVAANSGSSSGSYRRHPDPFLPKFQHFAKKSNIPQTIRKPTPHFRTRYIPSYAHAQHLNDIFSDSSALLRSKKPAFFPDLYPRHPLQLDRRIPDHMGPY